MEFTRAQMTRHYWGEFAGSLQHLGLSSGPQLLATVGWIAMLFGPGCCLSPIMVWRLTWQRWRARAVDCACAIAVAIGREQARPRLGVVRMVGRGFNWIDWLFFSKRHF